MFIVVGGVCNGCCLGFSRGGILHIIELVIGFMWQILHEVVGN